MQKTPPPVLSLEEHETLLENRIKALRNFINAEQFNRISICYTVHVECLKHTELVMFDNEPGKAIPLNELLSLFHSLADRYCAELLALRMKQPRYQVTATGELKTKGGAA